MTPADRSLKDVRAVLLAGGKGTRLRPFTVTFPKPLVPLGDRPILDHLLHRLADSGVTRVTISLGHLSSLIRAYISQSDAFPHVEIDFVEETAPLGTAGSLSLVEGLDTTFLVMNGDLLTDIDFTALVAAHRASGAAVTVSRYVRKHRTDFGVLDIDADGFIRNYVEKPEHTFSVSMGVYVYEPRALKFVEHNQHLDFPDLILRLIKAGEKVGTYHHEGMWLDIGRPDDYARAQALVEGRDGATEETSS